MKSAFVGAIRRSLAQSGDRRMVTEMADFNTAFVGEFQGNSPQNPNLDYPVKLIDSLSTFRGELQSTFASQQRVLPLPQYRLFFS